jgi:hypothetical protein
MVLRILSIVASMRSTAVAVSFDAQSGTQSEVINITKGFHCFDKGALDENGRSSFQLLQGYGKAKHTPLVYYAFDLLSLDSADLRSRPLTQRRKLLAKLLEKSSGEYQILRGANWYKGRASPSSKAVPARRPDRKKTKILFTSLAGAAAPGLKSN